MDTMTLSQFHLFGLKHLRVCEVYSTEVNVMGFELNSPKSQSQLTLTG